MSTDTDNYTAIVNAAIANTATANIATAGSCLECYKCGLKN